jgi:hypothetical protein
MPGDLAGALRAELSQLLAPLQEAAGDPQVLSDWLATLGQTAQVSGDPALLDIARQVASLVQALSAVDLASLQPWDAVRQILDTASEVSAVWTQLRAFAADPQRAAATEGLAEDVMSLLLASYLRRRQPTLFRVAALLTIIAAYENAPLDPGITANGTTLRYPRALDRFQFTVISDLLSAPGQTLQAGYFPNDLTAGADAWAAAGQLFPSLSYLADQVGLAWRIEYGLATPPAPPDDSGSDEPSEDDFTEHPDPGDGSDPLPPAAPPPGDEYFAGYYPAFSVVLAQDQSAGAEADAELRLIVSSSKHPNGLAGYVLTPAGNFNLVQTGERWKLTVSASGQVPAFAIEKTKFDLAPDETALAGGDLKVVVERLPPEGSSGPVATVGSAPGSRLELSSVSFGADLFYDPARTGVALQFGASSCTLVLAPQDADSFLGAFLPPDGVKAPFDLGLSWSNGGGVTFRGAASLDATLPVGLSLAGLSLPTLHLGLQATDAQVAGEISASVGLSLGPVHAVVDRVGLTTALTFPPGGGNLGPADVGVSIKPPSGAGIVIDAGVVTGGGFLEHTGDEYGGALDLVVQGTPVKAYGLIQTKLPGGQSGYSFIAVISVEFLPPVTLPFGFLLEGVGGLIGINRTISQSAVESALWAHHLDGLLFPHDPVASAPQLLSALDTYFPAAQGRYIIGPMVKIGWSANLVVGEVAVLLELPEPLTVLLIGDIQVTAPLAVPQLVLHISFDGGIDFGAKLAFFDATLHDSKLAGFPISGDLAFRYGWGDDDAVFALAVGGFNPQFQPPAAFPALKRLAISISSSVAKLDAQAYLALTSNTLQFGARAELTAGTGGFNVHGWLGFDALFEKDPLSFEFDLSAGVDLRSGTDVLASVHLDGTLSGPTPWHISGKASVSLLFFHTSVHFDKTWGGDAGPVSVPDPLAALLAALADRSGWSAQAAPGVGAAITPVAAPSDAGDAVLLDPAGALRIAQRAVPLDQPITRFGGVSLGRTVSFSVDSLAAFGQPAAAAGTATEEFAAAQFLDFTDAEKLSLPSFSRFDAGVDIGASAVDLGQSARTRAVLTPIAYDTTIIDTQQAPPPDGAYRPGLAAVLALNGSLDRPAPGLGRYAPAPGTPPRVMLAADQWVVASTTDLGPRADIPSDGTKLGAHLALQRYLSANPGDAGGLQIVMANEAG